MKRRTLTVTVLAVVAVIAAALVLTGNYMVSFALIPEEHGRDTGMERQRADERYPGIIAWYDSLRADGVLRDTVITGNGDYRLHGVYVPAQGQANGSAIVIHGYTDSHFGFLNLARMYREDLGFNVLMPELYFHGQSEGDHARMGWFDRLDIKLWANLAADMWEGCPMVIHGVSMGAATTMMVSGEEDLNPAVKAFVEDCGYSSVWNQFKYELKEMFHLPAFPVMHVADLMCRLRYGWDFREASSLDQLSKCAKPMLFIHGDSDNYVPTGDIYLNYEAKTSGVKEMWLAPDTDHATAYMNHPEEYTARVRNFLNANGFSIANTDSPQQ